MSTGVFGPGECIDVGIKATSDLFASTAELFNTSQFVNPQLTNILNMNSAADGVLQRADVYRTYLESIVPPPPDLAALLAQVDQFEAAANSYKTSIEQYQIWTNYLSGKSTQFPAGGPTGLNTTFLFGGEPQFYYLLAGFGFVGLWGGVQGFNQNSYVKCEIDPNQPCAGVMKVLGAVVGAYNTVINTMINGLNSMIDFAANIADYITQVLGFVDDMIAIVANAVAELTNQLLSALRDGLARALHGLKLDPCLGAVLQSCCAPALKTTLGI